MTLKIQSIKRVLHAVTIVTIVVGLHDFINDETVINFMIIDDSKELCYLDDLSLYIKK